MGCMLMNQYDDIEPCNNIFASPLPINYFVSQPVVVQLESLEVLEIFLPASFDALGSMGYHMAGHMAKAHSRCTVWSL